MLSDYDITKQSALRFGKWKLLTGDPGYPDFPITIPPQKHALHFDLLSKLSEIPLESIPNRPIPLTRLVRLFDIENDPLEEKEVSDDFMDVVDFMLRRLEFHNSTQVPVNFPDVDKKSLPKFHDGFWKPWLG